MTTQEDIDEEVVEQLRRSRNVLGEYYGIIYDTDGEILAGRHRVKAGWQKEFTIDTQKIADKLGISRRAAKELVRHHTNIQHRPSKQWTQQRLLIIAEELEASGFEVEKIATKVAQLSGYTHSYLLTLLPDKYKQKEKAVSPGRPPSESVFLEKQTAEDLVREIVQLRDTGRWYGHLSKPLMDKTGITLHQRLERAIRDDAPLEDVLKILRTRVGYTPAPSDYEKKGAYTEPQMQLGEAIRRRGGLVKYEVQVIREGEFRQDGEAKAYIPDLVVEDKVIVEVEGTGSASKENPERDNFLTSKGYVVKHVSNEDVQNRLPEVVEEIADLAGLPAPVTKPEQFEDVVQEAVAEAEPAREIKPSKRIFTESIDCPHCGKSFILNSDVPLPNKTQFDIYRSMDELDKGLPASDARIKKLRNEIAASLERLEQMEIE